MHTSAESRRREISEDFGLLVFQLLARQTVLTSTFMNGLKKAGIDLNRKMLSEIAISDPTAFTSLVESAKAAL